MLGIVTDNATNNNTMFSHLTDFCAVDGIKFDLSNQRVWCLGYIINLAVQLVLKNLKTKGLTKEDDLLENEESENVDSLGTVGKVNYSLDFWNFFKPNKSYS